jgi:nicotinamide phosphoribosyltransferase
MNNILTMTDFYKTGHIFQYPENTTKIYSNLTARMSRASNVDSVVFFGLQYFVKEYLIARFNEDFFNKPLDVVVKQYKRRLDNSLGKDAISMNHIIALHNLGYLPIKIKALKEGTECPIKVPMLTIENTHKDFAWVVNFLETMMSAVLWLPITSATTAKEYKRILTDYAMKTNPEMVGFVPWQGHDFSMRGMGGIEAGAISGMGHLVSFTGTDTITAIDALEQYYCANSDNELIGGSVPAYEHSTSTTNITAIAEKLLLGETVDGINLQNFK